MIERLKDRGHLIAFRWSWWHTGAAIIGLGMGVLCGALWGR